MMEQIRAQEQIDRYNVISAANGHLKDGVRRSMLASWRSLSKPTTPVKQKRKATVEELAAMGIKVKVIG